MRHDGRSGSLACGSQSSQRPMGRPSLCGWLQTPLTSPEQFWCNSLSSAVASLLGRHPVPTSDLTQVSSDLRWHRRIDNVSEPSGLFWHCALTDEWRGRGNSIKFICPGAACWQITEVRKKGRSGRGNWGRTEFSAVTILLIRQPKGLTVAVHSREGGREGGKEERGCKIDSSYVALYKEGSPGRLPCGGGGH